MTTESSTAAAETEDGPRTFSALEFILIFAGIVVAALAVLTTIGADNLQTYWLQAREWAEGLYQAGRAAIK